VERLSEGKRGIARDPSKGTRLKIVKKVSDVCHQGAIYRESFGDPDLGFNG